MKKSLLLTGILAAVAVAPAFAADQLINLQAAASPAAQLNEIRLALNTEDYSEITADDRRTVLDLIGRMERQVGEGGVETLNEEHKVRLFNWQAQVNTILVGAAEDSRLVCRREQKVGTRMTTTQCATVAQRRKMREAAERELRAVPRTGEAR